MLKKTLLGLVLAGFMAQAQAVPIEEALANYNDKKFELAFEQFKDLAELGSPIAQLNVGVMYARGEFVEKNFEIAYTYFQRAKLSGSPRVDPYIDLVGKKLDAKQRQAAEKRAANQIKKVESETRPITVAKATNADHMTRVEKEKIVAPDFPKSVRRDDENFLDLTFMVDQFGITRHQTILSSTHKEMLKPVIVAARENIYKPSMMNGKPVPTIGVFTRYMPAWGTSANPDFKAIVATLEFQKANAEAAGGDQQLIYGRTLLAVHTLFEKHIQSGRLSADNPNDWFFWAAQNGNAAASVHLGHSLLTGRMCQVDPQKGLFWLERAVADGLADAYVFMGLELIYGYRVKQDISRGMFLLRQVADAGYADAQLELAMFHSAFPDSSFHNQGQAQKYMKAVDTDRYTDQLTVMEAEAMVAAVSKDFDKAIKYQEKAIKIAERFGLPKAHLEENLSKLENKQAIIRAY